MGGPGFRGDRRLLGDRPEEQEQDRNRIDHPGDALEHAASWNSHLVDNPEAFAAAVDNWMRHLDEEGAGWITEGCVLLRRRDGRVGVRVDELVEEDVSAAGDQIERAFAARARLAALRGSILDVPVYPFL